MSAPDRSWTIAPALLSFGAFLAGALLFFDGNLQALADRLTSRRDTDGAPVAGPTFTAKPIVVADVGDDKPPANVPPIDTGPTGDRSRIGALEDVCVEGTAAACKRWGMDGFYRAVAASQQGKLGRPVRVSWYGDSVIATDAIPGRLRARLQGTLGDGGPGFVFLVAPHRFCQNEVVDRSASGGWGIYSISTSPVRDHLYGPGGSTAETVGGQATLKMLATPPTHVELYYLAQPNGGTATLTADSEVLHVDTRADAKAPGYATGTMAGKKLVLETKGKVRVFGVDLANGSGVVVDNMGIVSANVKSFANHDLTHFGAQLGHRGADLVMIMIGANEAAWLGPGDKDTKEYQAHYEQILGPIRKARPDGACLVVSPTDQAEEKDGKYPSRPVMPVLVQAQRKAAQAQGCAFFSTYDWMGGKGSAAAWYRKGFVGSDFQHLSMRGAFKFADAVYDVLMAGVQRYAGH